jgi:hypothetical protein
LIVAVAEVADATALGRFEALAAQTCVVQNSLTGAMNGSHAAAPLMLRQGRAARHRPAASGASVLRMAVVAFVGWQQRE